MGNRSQRGDLGGQSRARDRFLRDYKRSHFLGNRDKIKECKEEKPDQKVWDEDKELEAARSRSDPHTSLPSHSPILAPQPLTSCHGRC